MTDEPNVPKWTPGPWEQRTLMVMANKGRDCIVHCGGMLKPIPQRAYEMEANARLIAEAPAMAEALERIANDALNCGCSTSDAAKAIALDGMRDEARAILARIRGETP